MIRRDGLLRILGYEAKLDRKVVGKRSFMAKKGIIKMKWSGGGLEQSLIGKTWVGIFGISG